MSDNNITFGINETEFEKKMNEFYENQVGIVIVMCELKTMSE